MRMRGLLRSRWPQPAPVAALAAAGLAPKLKAPAAAAAPDPRISMWAIGIAMTLTAALGAGHQYVRWYMQPEMPAVPLIDAYAAATDATWRTGSRDRAAGMAVGLRALS